MSRLEPGLRTGTRCALVLNLCVTRSLLLVSGNLDLETA